MIKKDATIPLPNFDLNYLTIVFIIQFRERAIQFLHLVLILDSGNENSKIVNLELFNSISLE